MVRSLAVCFCDILLWGLVVFSDWKWVYGWWCIERKKIFEFERSMGVKTSDRRACLNLAIYGKLFTGFVLICTARISDAVTNPSDGNLA